MLVKKLCSLTKKSIVRFLPGNIGNHFVEYGIVILYFKSFLQFFEFYFHFCFENCFWIMVEFC